MRLRLDRLVGGERRTHAVTAAALAAGAAYLGWRTAFTLAGTPLWLSVPLLAAEAWGLVQLALLALQAWRLPADDPPPAPSGTPISVVVRAAGMGPDALERSLLGCGELPGRPPVTVVDSNVGGPVATFAMR